MLYKVDLQQKLDAVMLVQFEAAMIPAINFSVVEQDLAVCGEVVRRFYSCTHDRVVANVQRGLWSCLMLCDGKEKLLYKEEYDSISVLIVCWKADQVTAERVGSFTVALSPVEIWPLEETRTWRRVRLI
jgi:hypothetical protein